MKEILHACIVTNVEEVLKQPPTMVCDGHIKHYSRVDQTQVQTKLETAKRKRFIIARDGIPEGCINGVVSS